ncbi:MAG: hypothetical protein KC550_04465, partial [Nanoarchaeota archaeon]|nr:hypothetical protein [Nanoarchaeota archaeon]
TNENNIDEDINIFSNDEEENYIPEKPGHFKSSLGINFSVSAKQDQKIKIKIQYDKYIKENDQYKLTQYKIEDIELTEIYDSNGVYQQPNPPIESLEENLKINYIIYEENNQYFISLIISNESLKGNHSNNNSGLLEDNFSFDDLLPYVFFRTKVSIQSNLGFIPLKKSFISFNIDEEFDKLFQSRKSYSSGNNIATYSKIESNNEDCYEIETTYIPRSNQKVLNPDVYRNIPDLSNVLSIEYLLNLEESKLGSELNKLVHHYSDWIEELSTGIAQDKHNEVKKRIGTGINLLSTNDTVREVFIDTLKSMDKQYIWAKGNPNEHFTFRPFQLAFVLMLIPDIVTGIESDYYEKIDLLWIPTGGGKTEAYLAISGFTILWNRHKKNVKKFEGRVSVFTRYTLRLLTSQQFQRSSRMTLSLDRIRNEKSSIYGKRPISIGILVGGGSTPNTNLEYKEKLKEWSKDSNNIPHPFPLQKCPICNSNLKNVSGENEDITKVKIEKNCYLTGIKANTPKYKYLGEGGNFTINIIRCLNKKCESKMNEYEGLPVYFVDEDIFKLKPDFLLATIDKLAMINFGRIEDYQNLFSPEPSLILQDELHLINSSLGTTFSNYESAIETYIKIKNNIEYSTKVITSTATPKNSEDQLQFLFGRQSKIFPPSGDSIEDSYYSQFIENEEKSRVYIGFCASGMPEKNFERDLSSAILATRIYFTYQIIEDESNYFFKEKNSTISKNYQTLVAYFNSLRELGGYTAMVEDDIRVKIMDYLSRLLLLMEQDYHLNIRDNFNQEKWANSQYETEGVELTSRKTTEEIQEIITLYGSKESDMVFPDVVSATNMISVGIDIEQFNFMIVCGQPKSVSEYIQSTSRVGRSFPGVVFVSHNPNKIRDNNYYQFFESFHNSYYKYSDPSTVSPYSLQALNRVVPGNIISLIANEYPEIQDKYHTFQEQKGSLLNQIDRVLENFPSSINTWVNLEKYYKNHLKKYNNL